MAPALVELTSSKERNSIPNNYLNFSRIAHLNIDLGVKYRRQVESSGLFPTKRDTKVMLSNDKKPSDDSRLLESSTSTPQIAEKQVNFLQQTESQVHYSQSEKHVHFSNKLAENRCKKEINTTYCAPICASSITITSAKNSIYSTPPLTTTAELRTSQPVADYVPSKNIYNIIRQKHLSVNDKMYGLNQNINKLGIRLHKLREDNISSHIACYVEKHDKVMKPSEINTDIQTSNIKIRKDKSSQSEIKANPQYSGLKKLYDLINDNDSTDEDELESKGKIPLRSKRQKSERQPPTPEVLHEWKQNRAKVGSQCSWLMLKITKLDEKIVALQDIYTEMKEQRKLKIQEEINSKAETMRHDNNNDKNGLTLSGVDQVEGNLSQHIYSRMRPYTSKQYHKYVKQQPTVSPVYNCRCLYGGGSCRLCKKQSSSYNDFSKSLPELCDESFHSTLSTENDVSLSFLLEQTLRKQKINTKVTITKSTKKKKKKQIFSSPTLSSHSTTPTTDSKTTPKTATAKSKSERSKSDEYSRKRYAASDISSKLKKFRKLSESHSCDSESKPSTPTNELASPLSQSHPASSISQLKKKKYASIVDYDINNIVIPYSMAASTRVERIQYKEIPTPGWRSVQENLDDDEPLSETELTDDEAFCERHSRCEILEKKRFTDYFQPVRRQRSTRTSEGPNSEPPSPACVEEMRSLVNTPVDSPVAPVNMWNRYANIITMNDEDRALPWVLRKFPLNETETKKLEVTSEPPSPASVFFNEKGYVKPAALCRTPSLTHIATQSPKNSHQPSPLVSPEDTGNNWTVKVLSTPESTDSNTPSVSTAEKQRKGIVLKLAKK